MIDYRHINSNESGLSIRAKINRMFNDLISSNEGINKLWRSITGVNKAIKDTSEEVYTLRDDLQKRLSDVLDYTDQEVNDLLTYVNGLYGGVNGFAESLDFQPKYPEDMAATVIGVGPGTFSNMLGEDGRPITVDTEKVVIFFKAAGVTYWKYKTVLPTIMQNEVTEEFGDSPTKVISQKFFTEKLSGVIGGEIDITDIGVLDDYGNASKIGLYSLKKGDEFVGNLFVSGDLDSSLIQQFIFGGVGVQNGTVISGEGGIVFRVKNVSSFISDIPMGSWGEWRPIQDAFMQDVSEEKYATLKEEGKLVEGKLYLITEE